MCHASVCMIRSIYCHCACLVRASWCVLVFDLLLLFGECKQVNEMLAVFSKWWQQYGMRMRTSKHLAEQYIPRAMGTLHTV